MHFIAKISLLLLVSVYVQAEQSLATLRTSLMMYEEATLHLISGSTSLANISQPNPKPSTRTRPSSFQLYHKDARKVGPSPFSTYDYVVKYNRTKKEAGHWGDVGSNSTYGVSLSSYILNHFYKDVSGPAERMIIMSLLQTVAQRCLIGQNVALAKLDPSEGKSMASNNSVLCTALHRKDVIAVRSALTVPAQEAAVRMSVVSEVQKWSDDAAFAEEIVGLFNLMMAVTTDIEVATLLRLPASRISHSCEKSKQH